MAFNYRTSTGDYPVSHFHLNHSDKQRKVVTWDEFKLVISRIFRKCRFQIVDFCIVSVF